MCCFKIVRWYRNIEAGRGFFLKVQIHSFWQAFGVTGVASPFLRPNCQAIFWFPRRILQTKGSTRKNMPSVGHTRTVKSGSSNRKRPFIYLFIYSQDGNILEQL